ncbi:uncharacterized protein LOC135499385 [Lineus longissimus]|uniref:uncharacterized protein LOC135499385 n=1 Tax=Lineus longissimus TaxID=88925 RepID=UPI00315DEC82
MLFLPMIQAVAGFRHANYQRTPASSEELLHRQLHLMERDLEEVTEEYHRFRNARDCYFQTSVKRMRTFLLYLASGGYHRQVGYTQGIAKSTAILHNQDVADFFFQVSPRYISLPGREELDILSSRLQDVQGNERNVILYIDGVIIKIQRPDHAGDAYYCGRHGKGCDSINVQIICDKFGRIRHVITGIPGATHDKTAAEFCRQFRTFLDGLPPGYVVLGDPAYRGLHPSVLHTFIGRNLNPAQLQFNDRCTRLRQIVERTIGANELKWRMNQLKENRYPAKSGPEFASMCTIATCVLHNRFTNFLNN